jgi:hypothetical protein
LPAGDLFSVYSPAYASCYNALFPVTIENF